MIMPLVDDALAPNPPLPLPQGSRPNLRWPDGLALRQRRPDDAANLFALLGQDDFQRNGWILDPFTSAEEAETLLRSGSPDFFEIVALFDDMLVGYAAVYPLTGRQRHTGTLTICVHERFQRRGVGTALLACLATTARVMIGLSRLQLTVFVDNERAIALYKRFGFATEGRIKHFVARPDGFVDAFLMALVHVPAVTPGCAAVSRPHRGKP